jgi:hypothetical protein
MDSLSCSWIVTLSLFQLVVVAFRVSTCAALRRYFLGDSPSNHGARRSPPVEGSADDRLY